MMLQLKIALGCALAICCLEVSQAAHASPGRHRYNSLKKERHDNRVEHEKHSEVIQEFLKHWDFQLKLRDLTNPFTSSKPANVQAMMENLQLVDKFFTGVNNSQDYDHAALTYLAESKFYGDKHKARTDDKDMDWLYAAPDNTLLLEGVWDTNYTYSNRDTAVTMQDIASRPGCCTCGFVGLKRSHIPALKTCPNVIGANGEVGEWRGWDPVGLNLANATTPGGGALNGQKTQEESLCRSGPLFWLQLWLHSGLSNRKDIPIGVDKTDNSISISIKSWGGIDLNRTLHGAEKIYLGPKFKPCVSGKEHYPMEDSTGMYDPAILNKKGHNPKRSGGVWNGVSYTPYSPQLREQHGKSITICQNDRLFRPLAFISKAAECFSANWYYHDDEEDAVDAFRAWFHHKGPKGGRSIYVKYFRAIAWAAFINGHDAVVLGAIGCGVFSNDPELVAQVFNQVFRHEFVGVFKEVVFCCLSGHPATDPKIQAFKTYFIEAQGPQPNSGGYHPSSGGSHPSSGGSYPSSGGGWAGNQADEKWAPHSHPSSGGGWNPANPADEKWAPHSSWGGSWNPAPHSQAPVQHQSSGTCRHCTRKVNPHPQKNGRPYTTCCRACAKSDGTCDPAAHDQACRDRNSCENCPFLVNPGKNGRPYKTCCKPCGKAKGKKGSVWHDVDCWTRNHPTSTNAGHAGHPTAAAGPPTQPPSGLGTTIVVGVVVFIVAVLAAVLGGQ